MTAQNGATGHQLTMTQKKQYRTAVGFILSLATLCGGCSADVLSFDATNQADALSGALNLAGTRTVASLDEPEAERLCTWLGSQGSRSSQPERESSPGYVSGATSGFEDPTTRRLVLWVKLEQSQCVLNLRNSACESTIESRQRCIGYFADHNESGFAWQAALDACAEYEAAASCRETVVQYSFLDDGPDNVPPGPDCDVLPISPNATAPVSCKRAD
jgi:hypothetical protein